MTSDLKRTVEALLFAAPDPLPMSRMQALVGERARGELKAILAQLRDEYDQAGHAFMLREIAGGWRIMTRPEHSRVIEEMLKGQRRVRLSKAALEVLAVVAYRQPCTRIDIENVRGVNCGGPLATLHERGLVRITGRAESLGRPLLYATTAEFLGHLGINELQDLPQMNEIEALLSEGANGDGEASLDQHRSALLEQAESLGDLIGYAGGNGNGDGETQMDGESNAEALAMAMRAQYEAEREALGATGESPLDDEEAMADPDPAEAELLEESEP